ncbi:hypothetical protein RN001_006010 [Aquatica leii]|uniref:Regulatory protein zeste n=1 Tax=Aquatica leii TaxID=1421715 RepID=A0AAN7SAZ7_9COLE|nr:hypothetical protein RN001_006010 [Aquatica leii]
MNRKNYSPQEKIILLDIMKKYSHILENKETNKNSSIKKIETWQRVENDFNCQNQTGIRTWKQLRILYHNLKRVSRKEVASENRKNYLESSNVTGEMLTAAQINNSRDKKESFKTGGGVYVPATTSADEQILALFADQVKPLHNEYDDAAIYFDRLGKKIEYFNKTTIQNYLAQERWEKTEKMTIETESQTDAWKAHSKETKEIAIQTTQWTAEGKEMIDSVENVNTYEEWKQVAEEEWGDSAYVHTKIVEGHPLQETTGTSTLWVTEKEVEENTGLQLMIEKVYPEINKGKEEIETMERETKTKTKNNTNIKKIKIIRIIYQDHEEDVWKKLETIKSETEEDEKIMLHKLKTMSVNRLRKMTECIFKTKKTRINIIVPKDTQTQQSIAKQDNQKKTYALVVEQKGKNTKN